MDKESNFSFLLLGLERWAVIPLPVKKWFSILIGCKECDFFGTSVFVDLVAKWAL